MNEWMNGGRKKKREEEEGGGGGCDVNVRVMVQVEHPVQAPLRPRRRELQVVEPARTLAALLVRRHLLGHLVPQVQAVAPQGLAVK